MGDEGWDTGEQRQHDVERKGVKGLDETACSKDSCETKYSSLYNHIHACSYRPTAVL